jgi:uncharacterized protein YecE (DUF72 family)
MIRIGTSGYSYEDWKGAFYPDKIKKGEMLPFYATYFDTTELNFTYYTMPNAFTMEAMARKTPPGFVFVVKANQDLTHNRATDTAPFSAFEQGVQPLIEAGKFGCVLAQFPNSFRCTAENTEYLRRFRRLMGDLEVVVEFRHTGWVNEATFDFLREQHLGFCCVDEPRLPGLIPDISVATSDTAYVRFHGRNAEKWWQHEEAWQRYNYLYSEKELCEWAPRIRDLDQQASTTYVFTNNHWQGQAITNAKQLKMIVTTE